MIIIEPENETHHAAVRRLHEGAFSTVAEADLVDRIRADGDAVISVVALEGGEVTGHAMLSRMSAPFKALGLGPVAVRADRRERGTAAHLIYECIGQARAAGWDGIFVLGDPAYYRRFSFSPEAAQGFLSPYAGPYLMLLAMTDNALSLNTGRIDYAPAFSALG